ncbi:MAG: hypothetical protein ACRDB6_06215 [Cetobacterium sp.]
MKTHILMGKLFLNSFNILKEIQKEVEKDLKSLEFQKKIEVEFKNLNFMHSFKKNFFTLLILSIMIDSKISKKNIVKYGKIILYLRQIVTSTDNVIDDEKKGIIFIDELKNRVVSNSLIMLFCQNFLTKTCLEIDFDGELTQKVFNKIYTIAKSESLRDREQYRVYPDENYILSNIHNGIGGELLKISLEVPLEVEKNQKLEESEKAIYMIGMSLQALDDFFDMDEDRLAGKVNLYEAKLLYSHESQEVVEEIYLKEVLDKAYSGFRVLEKNGYPINRREAKRILKKLFQLRGLKEYSKMLDQEDDSEDGYEKDNDNQLAEYRLCEY